MTDRTLGPSAGTRPAASAPSAPSAPAPSAPAPSAPASDHSAPAPASRLPRWLQAEPVRRWIRLTVMAVCVLSMGVDLAAVVLQQVWGIGPSPAELADQLGVDPGEFAPVLGVYGDMLVNWIPLVLTIALMLQPSVGAVLSLVYMAVMLVMSVQAPSALTDVFTPFVGALLVAPVVARYSRRGFALGAGITFLVLAAVGIALSPWDPDGLDLLILTVLTALTTIPALIIRRARLRARAQQAALEVAAQRERDAAEAERQRIAAELHDVVAHGLTIVSMQAAMLQTTSDPERRRESERAIEQAARQSLVDLRRMLTALRGTDRNAATVGADGVQDLCARLEEFAGRLEDAGFTVRRDLQDLEDLPPSLELTVLRLIQEATTNILKHAAPGGLVVLHSALREGHLDLEVSSPLDPPAESGEGTAGEQLRRRQPSVPSGFGLAGMHERVAVFGGRLLAGPDLHAGLGPRWVVSAELPTR
jgi:signal transduction histidine kinase